MPLPWRVWLVVVERRQANKPNLDFNLSAQLSDEALMVTRQVFVKGAANVDEHC